MAATPASTTTIARQWQRDNRFIIDPRQSKFMRCWEPILLVALLFTSVVTPFEVRTRHSAATRALTRTGAINILCHCGFGCNNQPAALLRSHAHHSPTLLWQVAFLKFGGCITPLWVINRLVDLTFYVDMGLTFRLAFYNPRTGVWVRDGLSSPHLMLPHLLLTSSPP